MNDALGETAAAFAKTAAAIRPDQLGDPTPCPDFTVAELLAHMTGTLADAERAARKEPRTNADPSVDGTIDAAIDGPAAARAAQRACAAWLEPSALDGMTDFGPGPMPAAFAAGITLHELALHGWDLARATGQDFAVSHAASTAVLDIVGQIAEQARTSGGYGPALPAEPTAGAFERALAASGRDAAWTS